MEDQQQACSLFSVILIAFFCLCHIITFEAFSYPGEIQSSTGISRVSLFFDSQGYENLSTVKIKKVLGCINNLVSRKGRGCKGFYLKGPVEKGYSERRMLWNTTQNVNCLDGFCRVQEGVQVEQSC